MTCLTKEIDRQDLTVRRACQSIRRKSDATETLRESEEIRYIFADITGAEGMLRKVDASILEAIQSNRSAITDPTPDDDSSAGYGVGSEWYNTATPTVFICLDASVGSSVWKEH